MVAYSFKAEFGRNEYLEQVLDKHCSTRYDIRQVELRDQLQGKDRIFRRKLRREDGTTSGILFTVEYKCDWTAERTGNLFIEVDQIAPSGEKLRGWVLSTQAQVMLFLLPCLGLLWWANVYSLKLCLPNWFARFQLSPWVVNECGRRARGLLIPTSVFVEECAFEQEQVIYTEDETKWLAEQEGQKRATKVIGPD